MGVKSLCNNLLQNALQILAVFIRSSWISLLIILLVGLLITQLDQGSALLVSLLNAPLNMVVFLLLLTGVTLIIGHYPIYLLMWRRYHSPFSAQSAGQSRVEWDMQNDLLGVGFITFREITPPSSEPFVFKAVDYLRGILGIALLVCISIVLSHAFEKFIDPSFPNLFINLLVFVILTVIYSLLWAYKDSILASELYAKKVKLASVWLFWAAALSAALAVMFTVIKGNGWNPYTFGLFTLHLILGGITYCFYKMFRTQFEKKLWLFPFNFLADNKTFIFLNSGIGFFAFLIIAISQFSDFFHPIVIILAFLHIIYGIFIVTLKHRFYYISNAVSNSRSWAKTFFIFIAPAIPLVLLLWSMGASYIGNDLHLLQGTKKGNSVSLEDYKRSFFAHIDTTEITDSTLYFIASYGGGLKANAWNLLVLDSLSHLGSRNILDQTVAMSGVSGGALGQHFFAALTKNEPDREQVKEKIRTISEANMLSRDISWLLGWDLVRELCIGSRFSMPDRAGMAMEKYASLIGDEEMIKVGYRAYWADLFQTQYYPMQVVNSAGTNGRRGISCSVTLEHFHQVFPNADNLCDLPENKTLTYTEAVSCSHRFPIFSPAAKVEGKGHYVDGGYYENSGMLSLLDLYWYLNADSVWKQKFDGWDVAFLQIRNDANAYLRSQVNIDTVRIQKIDESSEILAILSTIGSITHLPLYIENRLRDLNQNHIRFCTIDLPYRLNDGKLSSLLRAQKVDSLGLQGMNRKIDTALHGMSTWQTIEPPLARYLSKPAVRYMEAILAKDRQIFKDFYNQKDSI